MTRARILEKAYELYRDNVLVHGDERLSVVLESLGYTTGAGYQIWPNQAAFRRDLQIYVAQNLSNRCVEILAAEIDSRDKGELDDYVLAMGERFVDHLSNCDDFYFGLRFFAMGDDRPTEIGEALQASYDVLAADVGLCVDGALAHFGLVFRPGRTRDQLVTTIVALAEGFALRHRTRPASSPAEVGGQEYHPFSVALLSLAHQFCQTA